MATSAVLPLVLVGSVLLLVHPPVVVLLPWLVLVAALTVRSLVRVRRRTLTVGADGLEVQRDSYAMRVTWDQVVGVRRRLHHGVIPVDELVLSGSVVVPRGSTGKVKAPSSSLSTHPATTRILVSLYDKRWRDGPIGEHLPRLVEAH